MIFAARRGLAAPGFREVALVKLAAFVESAVFRNSVLGLVVAAAVLVGLETSPTLVARYGEILKVLDGIIVGLFVVEALLKMAAHGGRWYRYFRDPWNVFDFVIVVVCLLPVDSHYAAVLRLVRVIRALRVVSALPRLQLLVGSLLRSLPSMGYIGLLLAILFYVYGVLGVFLWRENDPAHFADLPNALLSLFRVVTLEDWTDIMYTQMYGSDRYPFEIRPEQPAVNPQGRPILAVIYFVSFVLLGTMIVLNLFIGVILNSMDDAQKDREALERARHLRKLGRITLTDELAEVDRKLEGVRTLLDQVRRRVKRRTPEE